MDQMTPKVFSPSATETFSKCPRKWALTREGWKPRVIHYPELCAILGDGFSASMDVYNKHESTGGAPFTPTGIQSIVYEAGRQTILDRLKADFDAGRRIADADMKTANLLHVYLANAITLYVDANPLKDWTILASEETYPDHGKARLDLRASHKDVGVAVLDYKLKIKLEDRWTQKTIDQYALTQQRFHYQWMAGTRRFYIILVVLGPKPFVRLCPYGEVKYFDKGHWLGTSRVTWGRMERSLGCPPFEMEGSAVHSDQYGPCEYQEACLDLELDPALMNINYVRVPKIERKPLGLSTPQS